MLSHTIVCSIYKNQIRPIFQPQPNWSKIVPFQSIHIFFYLFKFDLLYKLWEYSFMGSSTFTEELSSPVPAGKLFKALVLDLDNLLPKIMPQALNSVETIEGDGGPGTIKKMNFTEG